MDSIIIYTITGLFGLFILAVILFLTIGITIVLKNKKNEINQKVEVQTVKANNNIQKTQINSIQNEVEDLKEFIDQLTTIQNINVKTKSKPINLNQPTIKAVDKLEVMEKNFADVEIRENLKEISLEKVLEKFLGHFGENKLWNKHVQLKDGNVVDVVVYNDEKNNLAIDNKFPIREMENLVQLKLKNIEQFKVKKKIISKKIKEQIKEIKEYTNKKNEISLSIIYISSESIFNFFWNEFYELFDYSINSKVLISSPATLAVMLKSQTITINDNWNKDEESLTELKDKVKDINKDIMTFVREQRVIQEEYIHLKNNMDRSLKNISLTAKNITEKIKKINEENNKK